MKLSESSLSLSSGAIAEVDAKHPIVLTDDSGEAVAAIIPIEDYYLLQKLGRLPQRSAPVVTLPRRRQAAVNVGAPASCRL